MPRLIDADELIASIQESLQELRSIYEMLKDGEKKKICNSQLITLLETLLRIREQPTVDAKPVVHAKWIWDERFHDYTCGNCHNWDLKTPNYCSNCGAKMDGENDGN